MDEKDSENKFLYGAAEIYSEGEEPIVFHHRDGEFRKYEKKVYSDLATGENLPKRGMFAVLVSTKMNRMIFMAMIMTFAIFIGVSLFGRKSSEDALGPVVCSLSAFSFGDDVYVSVNVEARAKVDAENDFPVDLEFSAKAVDSDGGESEIQEQTLHYDGNGKQVCRFTFRNYDFTVVRASVTLSGESKELSCRIESR